MLALYPTKKACKEATGTVLKYRETSLFGPQYRPNGTLTVEHYPHETGVGREWFGQVTLEDGVIINVK